MHSEKAYRMDGRLVGWLQTTDRVRFLTEKRWKDYSEDEQKSLVELFERQGIPL